MLNLNLVLALNVSEILRANSNMIASGHIWDHNKKTTQGREHKAAMTQRLWEEEVTAAAWCFWNTLRASQQRNWAAVRDDVLIFFFPRFNSTNLVKDSMGENKKIFGEKWDLEARKAEISNQVWKCDTSSTSNLSCNEWNYPCENSKRLWLT